MTVSNPDALEAIAILAAYAIVVCIASTGLFLILEACGVFDRDEEEA